ncbi:hypothetical protein OG809_16905 [Kribbella soli]
MRLLRPAERHGSWMRSVRAWYAVASRRYAPRRARFARSHPPIRPQRPTFAGYRRVSAWWDCFDETSAAGDGGACSLDGE